MSQDGWCRCNKCQELFYSDNPKLGIFVKYLFLDTIILESLM
jgi:hypothetical protein